MDGRVGVPAMHLAAWCSVLEQGLACPAASPSQINFALCDVKIAADRVIIHLMCAGVAALAAPAHLGRRYLPAATALHGPLGNGTWQRGAARCGAQPA